MGVRSGCFAEDALL